jgi:hypothetical protein
MITEDSWSYAISRKNVRVHLLISVIGAVLLVSFLPYFFNEVLLTKPGVVLNDFILNQFVPKDWSWIIFGLIYGSLLLTVLASYSKPYVILLGIECYLAINFIRTITLFTVTLEPPSGIIPLIDPVITKLAYGDVIYLKDLFFSGHVSTLFLLFLIEGNRVRKIVLLTATSVVALLILWQHVHYSIDVFLAPVFVWVVHYVLRKIHANQFSR